jgi:hypothetical protein
MILPKNELANTASNMWLRRITFVDTQADQIVLDLTLQSRKLFSEIEGNPMIWQYENGLLKVIAIHFGTNIVALNLILNNHLS